MIALIAPSRRPLALALLTSLTLAVSSAASQEAEVDEEVRVVLKDLARKPYSAASYEALFEHSRSKQQVGSALRWGKWLYWNQHYSGLTKEAEATGAQLAELYENWNADAEIVANWQAGLLEGMRSATGSAKHYLVAGHIINKLLNLDPTDPDLNKEYDKLFKKAGGSVTGGAFSADRVRRRSPAWIERQNREHEAWEDAFERKTKYYKILTNISYEFFETVSVVMDDMFRFYQQVYNHRKKAPVVTLAIHKKRSDFDKYCIDELGGSLPLGVGGWFYDRAMTVAAYDRTESGVDLSDLYSTLFHEASHQFMYLLTEKKVKQDPPTWLNEGTASYFEGCELKADGSIVKNKPALNRVREWERLEGSSRKHSLEELIRCPHRKYDGSFYSYGWALVYFLNNFEDEAGNLVYRDAYLAYLDSYTKKGPRDPQERADEAFNRALDLFVTQIDDPEVKTWEAFENRWRKFTQLIVQESKAGPEFADELQNRCRRYLERGDFERALITAEQADDKRPDDGETYRLMALASAGLEREGDAVYWMLRHWESAWASGDDDAAKAAEAWLDANEGDYLVAEYCTPFREADAALERAMVTAAEDGQPVMAALHATHLMQAFGLESEKLTQRISDLRSESGEDLRLWLRAFVKDESANRRWGGIEVVKHDPDGVLINNPEGAGRPREDCRRPTLAWIAPPYEIRGDIQVDGENGGYVYMGIGRNGRARSAISFREEGKVAFETVDLDVDEDTGRSKTVHDYVTKATHDPQDKYSFHLEVTRSSGVLTYSKKDGRKDDDEQSPQIALPDEWEYERLSGRTGISAGDDTLALFRNLEIRTDRSFWPVDPTQERE